MTTLCLQIKRHQSFPDWATGRRGRTAMRRSGTVHARAADCVVIDKEAKN